jgi:hypothetical protein
MIGNPAGLLATLAAEGFDRCEVNEDSGGVTVRCSQCDALVLCGVACHETGCPNASHECRGCNARLTGRREWCDDCN